MHRAGRGSDKIYFVLNDENKFLTDSAYLMIVVIYTSFTKSMFWNCLIYLNIKLLNVKMAVMLTILIENLVLKSIKVKLASIYLNIRIFHTQY